MLPGERNEIVVDFSDGQPAMLVTGLPRSAAAAGSGGRGGNRLHRRNDWEPGGLTDSFEVLELTVYATLPAFRSSLPRQRNSISSPAVQRDWPVRRFEMFLPENDRRRRTRTRRGQARP